MKITTWFILACWLVLMAVWLVSAPRAKRSLDGGWTLWRQVALRLAIAAAILLALRLTGVNHPVRLLRLYAVNRNLAAGILGDALCAMGVALAVAARLTLGRNWGFPMSRKADPALVTAGPYSVIRHPIYSGVLLAMLGSAIGQSVLWIAALLLLAPYYIYSARREERLMLEQFPDQYAAYMKRTKMLVPFIL